MLTKNLNIREAEKDVEVTQEVSGEVNNKKKSNHGNGMLVDVENLLLKKLMPRKEGISHPECYGENLLHVDSDVPKRKGLASFIIIKCRCGYSCGEYTSPWGVYLTNYKVCQQ